MTLLPSLLAFVAAASVLTVTPGLDTAIVLRTAATSGAKPAWFAAIGIGLGCLAWGAAVAAGLGAVFAALPMAFSAIQWAGAIYLVWMGAKLLFYPRSQFRIDPGPSQGIGRQALLTGLLTNLLNPKVGVFYIAFLPQFIPAGWNVAWFTLLLATIHVLLGLIWFACLIIATIPLGNALRRSAIVKTLDRLTGGVFILFGVKLALFRPS